MYVTRVIAFNKSLIINLTSDKSAALRHFYMRSLSTDIKFKRDALCVHTFFLVFFFKSDEK